jgi:hypothetical protein
VCFRRAALREKPRPFIFFNASFAALNHNRRTLRYYEHKVGDRPELVLCCWYPRLQLPGWGSFLGLQPFFARVQKHNLRSSRRKLCRA